MRLPVLAALGALALAVPAAAELPDLGGREVTVVTENAYPPLQFVDPATGEAKGWEYDAMADIAKRLNFTLEIVNMSWDAMIPAVRMAAKVLLNSSEAAIAGRFPGLRFAETGWRRLGPSAQLRQAGIAWSSKQPSS